MKTDTPLLLEEYFFPVVQVVANSSTPEEEIELNFDINVTLRENESEGKKLYQVAVDIHSTEEIEESKQPYTIHLVAIGIFSVVPEFPDIPKLLHITGSSMLYSAAREFLITITSRGPWDAISLPTFSFFNQYNTIIKKVTKSKKTDKIDGIK